VGWRVRGNLCGSVRGHLGGRTSGMICRGLCRSISGERRGGLGRRCRGGSNRGCSRSHSRSVGRSFSDLSLRHGRFNRFRRLNAYLVFGAAGATAAFRIHVTLFSLSLTPWLRRFPRCWLNGLWFLCGKSSQLTIDTSFDFLILGIRTNLSAEASAALRVLDACLKVSIALHEVREAI